jgi:hypothetical protein
VADFVVSRRKASVYGVKEQTFSSSAQVLNQTLIQNVITIGPAIPDQQNESISRSSAGQPRHRLDPLEW